METLKMSAIETSKASSVRQSRTRCNTCVCVNASDVRTVKVATAVQKSTFRAHSGIFSHLAHILEKVLTSSVRKYL